MSFAMFSGIKCGWSAEWRLAISITGGDISKAWRDEGSENALEREGSLLMGPGHDLENQRSRCPPTAFRRRRVFPGKARLVLTV